jgi:hypothetical protein
MGEDAGEALLKTLDIARRNVPAKMSDPPVGLSGQSRQKRVGESHGIDDVNRGPSVEARESHGFGRYHARNAADHLPSDGPRKALGPDAAQDRHQAREG